ncbi:MAG: response regulator [Candidatus Eisenbacteria bacterium]|nr:response regulator [Candidatus Eisenbacteria bacterium]
MNDRVLVCDDDSRVRGLLGRLLASHGFSVRTADCGEHALEEISRHTPDLLLLDITMPGLSGFEVCRRVRRMSEGELLPIVLITGLPDTESRIRGLESGADEFVSKPFEHAVLLARIRALLRVKHLTDQLERTENVIFTLARTVEARDSYTDGHLWRLAEYSRTIATSLGCGPEDARHAWYGGILHDIGKIGIDDSVLRKCGSLTPSEFAEVRRHPDIGAEIVSSMRFAPVVAPIVRGHHERWDGGGYPQGLAGEAIPLHARIVSVADAFDAMTTDRPYRSALDQVEAVHRLREGCGAQWDPTIVDVFVDLLDRGELPRTDLAKHPRNVA